MFEKIKKKVGDTIVEGTTDSVKTKIKENKEDILQTAIEVALVALAFSGACHLISPKPRKNEVHVYIHYGF